jgi:cytochrome c551/c552
MHEYHHTPDRLIEAHRDTFVSWGQLSFISALALALATIGCAQKHVEDTSFRAEVVKHRMDQSESFKKNSAAITSAMKVVIDNRAAPFPKTASSVKASASTGPINEAPAPLESDPALIEKGRALFSAKICNTCHSINGTKIVGPTMQGIWGRKEKMTDGTELYVDEKYFTRSIKEPNAQVVDGFVPAMPPLPVSDDEIKALMHYVASIEEGASGSDEGADAVVVGNVKLSEVYTRGFIKPADDERAYIPPPPPPPVEEPTAGAEMSPDTAPAPAPAP